MKPKGGYVVKPLEMASLICGIVVLLSGAAMWLIFKKYPSADATHASRAETVLKCIVGVIFLVAGLLDFVFVLLM